MMNAIKKILSNDRGLSSKRVIGTLCVISYILFLTATFFGVDLSQPQESLLINLLYVGGSLLGVGIFENRLDAVLQKKGNDDPKNMSEN